MQRGELYRKLSCHRVGRLFELTPNCAFPRSAEDVSGITVTLYRLITVHVLAIAMESISGGGWSCSYISRPVLLPIQQGIAYPKLGGYRDELYGRLITHPAAIFLYFCGIISLSHRESVGSVWWIRTSQDADVEDNYI